jgi:hypothetical protein
MIARLEATEFRSRDNIVTRLSDRRRGIGLTIGFIGLQCTIAVTAYHNVQPFTTVQ